MSEQINPRADDYFLQGGARGVLLTHGFAGSAFDVREIADRLHQCGATVLVKRLAGHGLTARALANTKIADWQKSLVDAGDRLRRAGATSVLLVGNSFGGNLLIDLSLHSSVPVDGLVLLSMPVFTHGEWWKRSLLPLVIPLKFSIKKYWLDEKTRKECIRDGAYLEIPLRALREFMSVIKTTRRQINQIKVPILLIYSMHDSVIKPHSADYIMKKMKNRAQLYWVNDADHSPLKSNKKGKILSLIEKFYRQRGAFPENGDMVA